MYYILIASILFFLPGFLITYLLKLDRYRFLLSFSISYALFVLLFTATDFVGLNVVVFKYSYFLSIGLLALLAFCKFYFVKNNEGTPSLVECHDCNSNIKWMLGIIFFVIIYFLMVGTYVELPSDVFSHMENIQEMSRNILRSENRDVPVTFHLGQNGKYWHYFYSLIATWSGLSFQEAILPASIFNVSVYLLGVFWFARVVFGGQQFSSKSILYSSVATVFFTFFHFGVNIFSFVRYYAIAPVILNFVLYFSVMAIVIDFFREKKWNIRYLAVAGVIFFASLYIHRQEALFAVLMASIMSFYLFIQKHSPSLSLIWQGQSKKIKSSAVKIFTDKINLSFLLTQATILSLFVYSYISLARHPITKYKLVPLEDIFPFFKNLYILNPNYQFFYVVSLWGIAVIILFILNIKKFRNNAFLMAGMLSPFFTVFNPFFTDLFLRHSWGEMLWRMSFLVPLQLVGAYLFVIAVQQIWTGAYLKKASALLTVILLVLLLFPFSTTFIENKYSRILTLKPVPVENSPEQWGDLLDYLNGIDKEKRIITDPVTGYMIAALTRHISYRKKFHRKWGGYIKFNFNDYSDNPFDRYNGYLFIINKRNGGMSETGRVAKHWPEGILQIENYYYSEKMEDYISSNPDRFSLLWEQDKIQVYSIDVPLKSDS